MSVIGLVAALVTISGFLAKVLSSTDSFWNNAGDWLRAEFSLTSGILIAASTTLFLLTWHLKRVNLRDVRELLQERDEEQARSIAIFHMAMDEADKLKKDLARISKENTAVRNAEGNVLERIKAWNRKLSVFLAVHGTTRHALFSCAHDMPVKRRTSPESQRLVLENVCRTVLSEFENLLSWEPGAILCCTKLKDGEGFHCMYPVTYEENRLLQSQYGTASSVHSIPASIIQGGRECYFEDINDAEFDPSPAEQRLLEDFQISGIAAAPLRIHEEYNQSTPPIGVVIVFLRNNAVPKDKELFRTLIRLFSEHLADLLQFMQIATRPATTRVRHVNAE